MKIAYVGDFGAGNTSLYCVNPEASRTEPEALNDSNGEPSGYALNKNGSIMLGRELFSLDYDQLSDMEKFRINLKAQPTEETADELVFYFKNWLEKIKREHPARFVEADDARWIIGCPTGKDWKKTETIKIYTDIFQRAGFGKVSVVPESNAALAFYQQTQGVLDDYDKGNISLLLLDQGAYSLDATVYGGSSLPVRSFGSYLGAGIIERMMLRMVLYGNEEENRVNKNIHNLPDVLSEVRRLYESESPDGKLHTYLFLKARELKEDYFTQERSGKLNKKYDVVCSTHFFSAKGNELKLFINEKMMQTLLCDTSIPDALGADFSALAPEVRDEVRNRSWMDVFRGFLEQLDSEFPQLSESNKSLRIMLTGGGSMMKCVERAVKEHYPDAIVFDSSKAISAIGMGMAYWAPDKIRAEEFSDAFEEFTEKTVTDDDGDSRNAIVYELEKMIVECVSKMAVALRDKEAEVVANAIVHWRDDYSISANQIPNEIETMLRQWCKDTGIPNFERDIDEQLQTLKDKLNKEFNKVQEEFGLPKEKLLKSDDKVFLSETKSALGTIFGAMIDLLAEHYIKNDLWSKFPTQRKGFFSNPRGEFCNAAAEAMTEWIQKELDSTIDICFQCLTEMEIDIQDESLPLIQIFEIEALVDLQNLMKKHKKKILGRLVLEEYLDDDDA